MNKNWLQPSGKSSYDPDPLRRFVDAQHGVYKQVLSELRSGRKRTHWIWFIFPQIQGLGHSEMSARYGISSLEEAKAYLEDPILGPRLRECTSLVNAIEGRSVEQIFGSPDDLKFRSSMTLFAHATQQNQLFLDALKKYYDGAFDPLTLDHLRQASKTSSGPG